MVRAPAGARRNVRDPGRNAPLIVSAELPPDLYSWANQLRQAHYPADRNVLKAHVTLFHALPPSCEAEIGRCLAQLAREAPVFARLEGVMKLGKGTALEISSPAMLDMREWLAERFHGLLMPQDEHALRLHVTIQNKVSIEEAKALQAQLHPQVMPRDFVFRGLELHAYRGGPWEFIKRWRFRG